MKEIPKRYNPALYEEKWAKYWVEKKIFASSPSKSAAYTIVIPPPNITGVLHMGHALNNVLQDIIIRFYKIKGYNTMWMPGTDHGGIATQNVVEKMLHKEGLTRYKIGREKFLERMWQWRDKFGEVIISQLKRLGCGCDWQRQRFTMDDMCSRAVVEAFIRLHSKGLIYRGEYIINWCVRCETALSDIEVEHKEKKGNLWYIKYPLKSQTTHLRGCPEVKSQKYIVVATTRPETMLGDTAVAVHPDDKRYSKLIGAKVILPVTGREIEIITDNFVDPSFGTGMVKVTPAHDVNDFEIGRRHKLPVIKVIDEKGKMTEEAGEFKGYDRFECRKKLVEKLKRDEMLEKVEEYTHSVGYCYRCLTVIEPLVSMQWFVRMKGMASNAINASKKKKISFVPERWEKPYINWLENIHDWCISRQIWWGHRIPVYYCKREMKNEKFKMKNEEKTETTVCPPIVSAEKPKQCPICGSEKIIQDDDVLDTWFSSSLWPFSTLNWPDDSEDLKYYYPTKVLVTGHEILNLWVARMVMMGLEMAGDIPFDKVNIHGIIRDERGIKMSKSLGNVIDPIDVIENYGTDALRFALAKSAVPGRDIQLTEDDFISARNFCNKLFNASRLILSNLEIKDLKLPDVDELELADKWILSEALRYTGEIEKAYSEFNNARAARLIYEFTWNYFCDWYLEIAKLRLYSKDGKSKIKVECVLINILIRILNLIHPIMPFISSELWGYIAGEIKLPADNPLGYNSFNEVEFQLDESEVKKMNIITGIVSGIRNIRGEMNVQPSVRLDVSIRTSPEELNLIKNHISYLKVLATLQNVRVGTKIESMPDDAVYILGKVSVYVTLPAELKEQEMLRLKKRISELSILIERLNKKLANREFLEKAPPEIIERSRNDAEKYEKELESLKKKESW